jgi:hypothetical protein
MSKISKIGDTVMTEVNPDRILFLYIHDHNEPRRVLTIARSKVDNILTFAWCINKVTTDIRERKEGNSYYISKHIVIHDTFRKVLARKITEKRLGNEHKRYSLELQEGERPLQAMLDFLAGYGDPITKELPLAVKRLARQALHDGLYTNESNVVTF